MPTIIIQSPTAVFVDGENYGKVADTIANNKQLASDIQIALEAWAQEKETTLSEITADRDRLAALLADASAAFDAGDIAKLTAMREDAQKTENEKKLQAALAKKAEAESEIAALAK